MNVPKHLQVPDAVRNNKIVIEVCPKGTQGCSDGSAPAVVEVRCDPLLN